jgi:peptide/nickel transport system substrate-binding protein
VPYGGQTSALVAGEVDLGVFPPLSDVPVLQDAGLNIISVNGGYAEGWYFNMRDMATPAIKNVVVRQAIAMAIDREAIALDVFYGLTTPAETFWDALEANGYVSPDIEPWVYDPDLARALLQEAGYVDRDGDGIREDAEGNPLVIYHGTTHRDTRQYIQEVTKRYLADIGIDMQIENWSADLFFGSYTDGAAPAVGIIDIMEWSDKPNIPDPSTDYWYCDQIPTDENPWGYNFFICDEELDALFQAQLVEFDPNARAGLFQQISKYVHDQVYWLGLFVDPDLWVTNPRLTGVKFSGVTPFYNIMEWDIAE